jgi:hypothetical protein
VGLEVNAEKTKYMLPSRHQNAGQNHDINIVYRSFANVAQFRYLGTKVTNQNLIQEEIKRMLYSGSACYHEPGYRSRYSDWLRAGRPRDRSSSPGKGAGA